MFKILMKKQFMEVNQFFFVNKKTGQLRSRGKRIGSVVAYVAIMVVMCSLFLMLSSALGGILIPAGLTWLYFGLMACMTLIMGVFGTVFNSYSALFHAKDNELLLSMPIPVRTILMARLGMTYLLALMYCAIVWLPATLYYVIIAASSIGSGVQAAVVLTCIFMTFLLSLLTLVLSCGLGWVVAMLATRVKNKSFVTVFATVTIMVVYYYVYFQCMEALQNPESWLPGAGEVVMSAAWPLYQLGLACCGSVVQLLVITLLTVALMVACWLGMSKSFMTIVSGGVSRNAVKAEYQAEQVKCASVKQALQQRELKRWLANPTYLMNTGLGVVFMVVVAGAALINQDALADVMVALQTEMPGVVDYLPLLVVLIYMMLAGMDAVCTPSVSLEGKTLWILRSLPLETRQILDAKMNLQLMVNAAPAVICTLVVGFALGLEAYVVVAMGLAVWAYVWLSTCADMILGLTNVNLNWTSEVVPVKQSGNVMLALFGGWAVVALVGGLAYLTLDVIGVSGFLVAQCVLFAALTLLARKWIFSEGVRRFEAL